MENGGGVDGMKPFSTAVENEETNRPEGERIAPKYISKDGFIETPIRRDLDTLRPLLNMIRPFPAYVCGGYVRWMCSMNTNPIPATDIDIYSQDEQTFDILRDLFKDWEVKFENPVSVQFKIPEDTNHWGHYLTYIQLIKPIKEGALVSKGSLVEILKNFDFTVIRAGILRKGDQFVGLVDADFPHDEAEKILRIKNIHCPISSTYRCIKYCRKGYWLPTFQCLQLFIDWEQRDDAYRQKITDYMKSAEVVGLTHSEIDHLEALLRID